ncbi:MAG: hypothetical protein AAFQ35_14230 [Pseudomonadota bacterium]
MALAAASIAHSGFPTGAHRRTPHGFFSAWNRAEIERAVLWVAMSLSGIVFFEPAPFDLLILLLIGLSVVGGMHLPRALAVPLVCVGVLSVTGLVAAGLSTTMVASARHVLISIFLYMVLIGLAALIARNPARILPVVFGGYQIAAVIACAAAVIGYFGLVDGLQKRSCATTAHAGLSRTRTSSAPSSLSRSSTDICAI